MLFFYSNSLQCKLNVKLALSKLYQIKKYAAIIENSYQMLGDFSDDYMDKIIRYSL